MAETRHGIWGLNHHFSVCVPLERRSHTDDGPDTCARALSERIGYGGSTAMRLVCVVCTISVLTRAAGRTALSLGPGRLSLYT